MHVNTLVFSIYSASSLILDHLSSSTIIVKTSVYTYLVMHFSLFLAWPLPYIRLQQPTCRTFSLCCVSFSLKMYHLPKSKEKFDAYINYVLSARMHKSTLVYNASMVADFCIYFKLFIVLKSCITTILRVAELATHDLPLSFETN